MACESLASVDFDLGPLVRVKWGHHIKKHISPLLLVSDLQNVKRTYGKSSHANLLQVSNFSFGICFKVKWGKHTKKALYLPYYWFKNFEMKTTGRESCNCGILPLTPASKRPYISLIIGSTASKCENNPYEICLANLLQVLNLIFDPCINI